MTQVPACDSTRLQAELSLVPGESEEFRGQDAEFSAEEAGSETCTAAEPSILSPELQEWHKCSGYLEWHHQLYVKPRTDDATLLRRAGATPQGAAEDRVYQKLGEGWIEVPDAPPAW